MKPHELPVYRHRDKILSALETHQVIVVESPTGSGKTTQLPVILHEAGYSRSGMIGITQPRRIATISVSSFIQRQLEETDPGIVGYKMRFDDKTTKSTRLKIMTDGILLQEMKLDPMLSQYTVLMVDEAHERSLNIDFVLGLLKRVLEERKDFRVIVSSATINAQVFSEYFDGCPIVRIETENFPVSLIHKPLPKADDDTVVEAICSIVEHIVEEKREGDILVFLPGEKLIKMAMNALAGGPVRRKLQIIPLYGRLSKEEQDLVFPATPWGKTKVVISTNIAETSITIDGVTSVIDSGLAKINYYSPKTFTSSLVERPISRASANQRKGRAGRTAPGTCYRLYSKDDFESRPLFTEEEIYRTDLSEVVLRMAELGITDFDSFDFISSPGKQGIAGAVETLLLLEALNPDNTLSRIGELMVKFPLIPRHSRILVEAILRYPDVMEEALIGTAFLSTDSPFLLPQGEEMEARKAHHAFRDPNGDFVSYLRLFKAYEAAEKKLKFCEKYYLDNQTMGEIANIKEQLGQITGDIGVPNTGGGSLEDYLCAIAKGLIQFICIRNTRGSYRSLTAEKIEIHPGSVMYRETPKYIVAGEIVRTTKMYARSVGALKKEWLVKISPELAHSLHADEGREGGRETELAARSARLAKGAATTAAALAPARGKRGAIPAGAPGHALPGQAGIALPAEAQVDTSWQVSIAGRMFQLEKFKGKKKLLRLSWEDIQFLLTAPAAKNLPESHANLRTVVAIVSGPLRGEALDGEKLSRVLAIARWIEYPAPKPSGALGKTKYNIWEHLPKLTENMGNILHLAPAKKDKDLGFITLYTNQEGMFWYKPSVGFSTALAESLASLEYLADAVDSLEHPAEAALIGAQYRRLTEILESV
jgi:RNA helicase HrpA